MAKKGNYDYHEDWKTIDGDGAVIKEGVYTKTCPTAEDFVKIYLSAIDEMMKLDKRSLKVLMVCLKTCSFCDETKDNDGSIVTNNSIFKDLCREAVGPDRNGNPISNGSIDNTMSTLTRKGILLRYKCRGTYLVNPNLFIKGKLPKEVRIKAPKNIHPNKDFMS